MKTDYECRGEISEIQTTHWQFGLELPEKSKKDLDLLRDKLQQIKENQDIDFSVLKIKLFNN
ncbi:hypothetical protein INT80_06430 [Gallibacterium anatis]|uniref:Uncharacterized protein n=1 Tax=Gallibacterium anatis TaxID=750 RepID=A0A930Y518_9PAST|nr:hypothetical protein [Gallibacterium anatis]